MSQPIILAAVDLDHRASTVITHANRLAALCQGHLMVVHIVDYDSVYEDDHGFPQPPGKIREDMIRHARMSLFGMIHHLNLSTNLIEIQVKTGPVVDTLIDLAATIHPRYVLIGASRFGILGSTTGLVTAFNAGSNGQLLVVPNTNTALSNWDITSRIRQWIGQNVVAPIK
ncbi:hypothetical protein CCP3SC1_150036 [Gammaproteobacteria bacterium]